MAPMKGMTTTTHGDTATITATEATAVAKKTVVPMMQMTRRESMACTSFVNRFIKRLEGCR